MKFPFSDCVRGYRLQCSISRLMAGSLAPPSAAAIRRRISFVSSRFFFRSWATSFVGTRRAISSLSTKRRVLLVIIDTRPLSSSPCGSSTADEAAEGEVGCAAAGGAADAFGLLGFKPRRAVLDTALPMTTWPTV